MTSETDGGRLRRKIIMILRDEFPIYGEPHPCDDPVDPDAEEWHGNLWYAAPDDEAGHYVKKEKQVVEDLLKLFEEESDR